ncbi:hypothetical protein TNCV_3485061 [Trichonephila clavipes]|nr:hypothetical protein TNCV_3485061 [Trichonephila clavipes]
MWKKLQCSIYEREWKKNQDSCVNRTNSQKKKREFARENVEEIGFFSCCKINKTKETKKGEEEKLIKTDAQPETKDKAIQVDASDIDKFEEPKSLIERLVNVILHKIMFTAIGLKDLCRSPNIKWHTDAELDIQLEKIFSLALLYWPPFKGEEPQERAAMFRQVLNRMARNYTQSKNLRRHIKDSFYAASEPKISTYWNELLR